MPDLLLKFCTKLRIMGAILPGILCSGLCTGQVAGSPADTSYKLLTIIPLPGVSGRIDHMACNVKAQLVYIAALGNNSVEVVDLKTRKVVHTIKGLGEPQGIVYIPGNNTLFVANGATGECRLFDAGSYRQVAYLKLDGDADNVRFSHVLNMFFVGHGEGGIAMIDAATFKLTGDIQLQGHPESFQVDRDARIYVNVPDARLLEVIDIEKKSVTAKWNIKDAAANFPMALDAANHRLFIGCRNPAKLLVLDAGTGKTVTFLHTDGDTDDIFYDNTTGKIYMSCGGGYLDIFRQTGPDQYEPAAKTETRSGARTSLYIPELNEIVIAAPVRPGLKAQLMIYGEARPR
jgi:YVTN family beta-propeller protein